MLWPLPESSDFLGLLDFWTFGFLDVQTIGLSDLRIKDFWIKEQGL